MKLLDPATTDLEALVTDGPTKTQSIYLLVLNLRASLGKGGVYAGTVPGDVKAKRRAANRAARASRRINRKG